MDNRIKNRPIEVNRVITDDRKYMFVTRKHIDGSISMTRFEAKVFPTGDQCWVKKEHQECTPDVCPCCGK